MAATVSPKPSYLLMASGLIEVGAGLGLALAPGVLVTLFFGGGASKQAGKVSVDLVEPGKRVRVNFADYAKPGDKLGLELDVADNRLLGVAVASYMDEKKDAVQLDGKFALLDNGATYPKTITLNAPEKNIVVTVENSGYRKMAQ